ncbi:50S ribosomal protein L4 [endosymbiont of Sipalinus gigas]|nr:50S ribosomal protein L4 [endosymbiont of Sipalinus gigas]
MELIVYDSKEKIVVLDDVFNIEFNNNLVHQIIISESLLNKKNTKLNKNRSNVKGSNIKQWKQKGTGRARAGSKKSPIWRSGGVTFGNQINSYKYKINKKMYKKAFKCILSELIRNDRIYIFSEFIINDFKTKKLIEKIYFFYNKYKKILIIVNNYDKNLFLSSKNIFKIKIILIKDIILSRLINYDCILITLESIKFIENRLVI